MTTKVYKTVLTVCVVLIVISFFLPWVDVGSSQVGAVSELFTGKRQEKITSLSGVQIPVLANSDKSKLAITIIKIFNPRIKNADKKSWAVFLLPIIALLIYSSVYYFPKNKFFHLLWGIVGVAISLGIAFKVAITDLDKLVIQVKIGVGLWLIIGCYIIIGVMSFIQFGRQLKGKK